MFLPARLGGLVQQARVQLFHGEVVFMPGEALGAVYLIERGSILVAAPSGDSIRAVLGPLRIVGLCDFLSGCTWQGLGLAKGPTLLRVIETRTILDALACSPDGHSKLLHELAA